MNKLPIILCIAFLVFGERVVGQGTASGGKSISQTDFDAVSAFVAQLDDRAEAMKLAIRNTPDKIDIRGRRYYFSQQGSDSNDGLSPDTPMKTLNKLNSLVLEPGDGILFRRGDLWRGSIHSKSGVTYAAYGEGGKPRIYGSPYDAAQTGTWILTQTPNVYVFDQELSADIGTLVFDDGASCAFKVMKLKTEGGATVHIETKEPFSDYRDLKRDLDFYHDYQGAKRVYLCSLHGNPSTRFGSIELNVKTYIVYAVDDITVDNLCLKYCGAHAVGSGSVRGLTVTNCEIGWIGGSIQFEKPDRPAPTRYGNGIEIYGNCQYFWVDHCYVYEVYDAAITHQFSTGKDMSIVTQNVVYSNNLIENCVYSIEYFLGKADSDSIRYMKNVAIHHNLLRRSGFGWGAQRPDKTSPAHIKSWASPNRATNFTIRDNVFDRGAVQLLHVAAWEKDWLPTLQGNTYVQFVDLPAGWLGVRNDTYRRYPFDRNIGNVLQTLFGESNAKILYVEPDTP